MTIKEVKNNQTIVIYGVMFHGFEEIRECAVSHKPKDGVYVGCDEERYPCFDSYDYANEDRSYWNFVFAQSLDELIRKLNLLNECRTDSNYCKLTTDISDELLPMVYFEGSSFHPLKVTECKDAKCNI